MRTTGFHPAASAATMDADLMHMMHTWGVDVTHWLQNAAPGSADGLLLASRVGDPGNAWLLFFPVAFVYRRAFGLALLRATVFAEWLNLVLKWALNGERPYWWSKIHTPEVVLQQFPLTCETGTHPRAVCLERARGAARVRHCHRHRHRHFSQPRW